ncbi:hypothetical protein [Nocardioides perillae]|uniref:Uncharacterized protein n=1 Tax=Nocardioides perillae TaxID=1119534 RepID=A0A7Y9RU81_9ACTN|nr:hypothetical protein [Nocardioides perillae]NYG54683.1 hypothetical protein [Nocardioides perillae]
MSTQDPQQTDGATGRVSDSGEQAEPSSTTEGAAAEGQYDPAQGSPAGGAHPVGEAYPAEATRFDDPQHRRPDEVPEGVADDVLLEDE